MRRSLVTVGLAAALLAGRQLSAQVVSGVVVLPDSTTPVSGVIVVATNARGVETRALTNARGEYFLRLPGGGQYALKALRIGYRPTLAPSVSVDATGTRTARIVLGTSAVNLASVNVRDRQTCRVNADTGLMVTQVWDEARKAMLSTQLGDAGAPLFAEWIEYDQTLDSTARLVRSQRVRTSRNPTTHAFKSRPATYLDTAGYVLDERGIVTYYAPDADVLLSESFAAGHCFRLAAPPREHPEWVGVAFQPSRDRRALREIEGTLWLDRKTAELRTLEFRFTNLNDVVLNAGAGGRVEFMRLGEGHWLIHRWNLRMPQVEARRRVDATYQRMVIGNAPVLRAVQVTGGEVTRVQRNDSTIYVAVGPKIAIQVVGADSLIPASAAKVTLDGTDYTGAADANGRIELTPVLAGRYRAQVRTAFMDSLGLPSSVGEVEARTDARVDSIRLPTPRDVLGRVCPRDSIANGEGMLHGTVQTERAGPIANAVVIVTWMSVTSIISGGDADHVGFTERSLGSMTDHTGQWRICGAPRNVLLVLRTVSDSGRDERRLKLERDFQAVTLVAHRGATAANREVDAALGRTGLASALVEFSVTTPKAEPVPNVTLEVRIPNAGTRTITTGPSGRALLPEVKPGVISIRTRRIGFKPGEVSARVESGHNTVPIVVSEVDVPTLETMRIVGDRRVTGLGRLDGFDQRRVSSIGGRFVTQEEIEKQNPVNVAEILRRVPGVTLQDSAGVTLAVSGRGLKMVHMREGLVAVQCTMRIGVDGMLMENGFDMNLLSPKDIYGVEVYTPATIPPQYNGQKTDSFCGLVMIWKK